MGYVDFYLLTALAALPGIGLFVLMMRAGLVDEAVGAAAAPETASQA
jgi:PAT family beta-lactamase induction signal transducer AmpG